MRAESRLREMRTGLFVVVGLAIFVALVLWVAGKPPGGVRTSYEVLMKDAGGVRPGDQVRIAGVPVGRVSSVRLQPGSEWPVVFAMTLDTDVPLTRGSRAGFASDGILGSRFLAIHPGPAEAPPLADGEAIRGERAADFNEALSRVGEVIDRATVLLDETTKLVQGLSGRVDPLLGRLEDLLSEENVDDLAATLKVLRTTLEEAGPRLPAALDELESALDELGEGLAGVPELTAEAQGLVTDLRTALGPGGERLTRLLESADGTMNDASDTLGLVAGNAGDLEAATRDLAAASANLRALSEALKNRPNRLLMPSRKRDRRPGEGVDR